ncbi:unnamed protein product [Cylicostephanus goldi]|uniref:Ionotropic glutamate receptor L-glutamate and glycine-binding domain-containing protein n=1 Tax=Cylicostephanus goldi TaxID=71465 RepID=A0A3P7QDE2_CYLGO|nr:unnamed protein product [Cylicostephanus goldi]
MCSSGLYDQPFADNFQLGSDLKLAEESIHWTGGGRKPLEITLPKHLRVVIINDPPFVYVTPIISLAECKNLGTVLVELGPGDAIHVPGPWYPCPKYTVNYTYHYCCAGYAIDLLSNISLPEGYLLSGALGELDSDQADMAIGGMTINPDREKLALYIDFSEPWLYHGIRILEKSMDQSRMAPDDPFLKEVENDRVNFGEAMWFVWGVLLNSGVSESEFAPVLMSA